METKVSDPKEKPINNSVDVTAFERSIKKMIVSSLTNVQHSHEERPYLMKIGRDTLNFKSGLDWPEGGWQKGATTTLLLET